MSNEIPNSLSPEQIEALLRGETVVLSTMLESTENNPISLECYILPTPYPRKWILITAMAGAVEVGFVDARFFPETKLGGLESTHFSRSRAYDAPHAEIRFRSGDDGFFVVPEERNRGVGQVIFAALKAVLRGLNANTLLVQQPSKLARSFYEREGGEDVAGGYLFELE